MEKIDVSMYKDYALLRESIGTLQKSGVNPHFKNTYVELNTALQEVDKHIGENNFICFIQAPITIDGKNYLNTKLIHNTGSFIEANLELLTVRVDPQMLGSSLTYARRNSLLTVLGLQATDDDGEDSSGRGKIGEKEKAKLEKEKKKRELFEKLKACKTVEAIDVIVDSLEEKVKTEKFIVTINKLKEKIGEKEDVK